MRRYLVLSRFSADRPPRLPLPEPRQFHFLLSLAGKARTMKIRAP